MNFRHNLAAAAWGLCGALPSFGTCIISGSIAREATDTAAAVADEAFESPSVVTVVAKDPLPVFNSRPVGLIISFY